MRWGEGPLTLLVLGATYVLALPCGCTRGGAEAVAVHVSNNMCTRSHTHMHTQTYTHALTQDGGDAEVAASPRDIVYVLGADEAEAASTSSSSSSNGARLNGSAQAVGTPRVLAQTDLRCGGVAWGDDDLAILFEVGCAGVRGGCTGGALEVRWGALGVRRGCTGGTLGVRGGCTGGTLGGSLGCV